jgi:predicted RNase H-like HicB family nuclease
MKYNIVIEEAEGNYSAYCPELPGCVTTGKTVEETIKNMREAINLYIDELKNENRELPKPSVRVIPIEA